MYLKKALVALMCLGMVMGMFACGAPSDSGSPSPSPENTDGEAEQSDSAQELSLPIVSDDSVTLTYMGNDVWCPNRSFKDGLAVQNEIEGRTGVHIEWEVYSSDLETVLQTRLAAGTDLPDLVEVPPFDSNIGVTRYANNGVLISLTDLIDQYAPDIKALYAKYPNLEAVSTSADGSIYAIAGFWGDINEVVPDYAMIRQDWLTDLGLDMPNTPDELFDVLEAFATEDPNGNGENDEIALVDRGILETRYLMTGFGFPQLANDGWYYADGATHYAPVEDGYRDMLAWLNQVYEAGLLDTDLEGTQYAEIITQDKCGVFCHDPSDNMMSYDSLVQATDPDCDYEYLPLLKPTDDSAEPVMSKRNYIWHYYGITKDCEYPEIAMQWIDYVYASEDGRMLYNYGIEGQTYTVDDSGEVQLTENVTNNAEFSSPFTALRSYGAWPCYFINDSAEAFLKIFEGTKVETVAKQYQGKMAEPYPQMLGTEEESNTYTEIWPDLDTYLDEMYTKFVIGEESLDNWDDYVQTCYDMGLQQIIDVKDGQYQRYQEIVG